MKNIPKLLLIIMVTFSSFTFGAVTEKCEDYKCDPSMFGDEFRFPFRVLDHQPKPCGYPGFDVHCNGTKAILELPNSVIFDIDRISYRDQTVDISDPNNCLPSKLLSLNLSTTNFYALYYHKFAVFNCSGFFEDMRYKNSTISIELNKVEWLSGSNHTVYAVKALWSVSLLSSTCQWVANISVPDSYGSTYSDFSSFTLHWDEPRCGPCENIYRRCGLKRYSSHETECTSEFSSYNSNEISSKTMAIPIMIGLVVLMAAILGLVGWLRCQRRRNESATAGSIAIVARNHTTTGISQSTLDSYPTVVIDETTAQQWNTSEDNTCSICLSRYKINQVLKILPYCLHRFHVPCIDQWLVVDGTCPICRVVPSQSFS